MNIPCVPSASELSTVLRGACPSEGPGKKMFLLVDGERVSDRTENPPDDYEKCARWHSGPCRVGMSESRVCVSWIWTNLESGFANKALLHHDRQCVPNPNLQILRVSVRMLAL